PTRRSSDLACAVPAPTPAPPRSASSPIAPWWVCNPVPDTTRAGPCRQVGEVAVQAETSRSPYGSWPSPLSAADLAAGSLSLAEVRTHGGDTFRVETRPEEAGQPLLGS